ncbi:unnamed protein product [Lathyrus sativus]|nr:unnamed protein product [Lathyrus sativus]
MSRINRFLISESLYHTWQECRQWSLEKELFDHRLIQLCDKKENWGDKPFCMLNYWREINGYHKFVKEQWSNLNVEGWGMFVLKEKFKMIIGSLKEWHKKNTQNLDSRIKDIKLEINNLEAKGEE